MNNILKIVLAVVVLGAVTYLGMSYPKVMLGVASPVGATNSDAKIASIAMLPRSTTATSTSILNSDATDRIVTDAGVTCTGLTNMFGNSATGVATFRWVAATSSTAAPATIIPSTLSAMDVTVATSSVDGFTATSTYTSAFSRRWNANSYMVFETNATSSAAACTPFVHYVAS